MTHSSNRRIDLGSVVLGLLLGVGTNLVTGQVQRWWSPLRLVAGWAAWWLPGLVVAVLAWEYARRWRKGRLRAWRRQDSPYPGLEPYTAERATVFFGRDQEIRDCLAWLDSSGGAGLGRLLLLVGPSGVGKSSLLRAGVMPKLNTRWCALGPLRPGADPFNGLAEVLTQDNPERDKILPWGMLLRDEAEQLHAGHLRAPVKLLAAIREVRSKHSRVVIAIDQAEDMLAGTSDEGHLLWWYLRQLLDAEPGVRIIATVRTEFLTNTPGADLRSAPMVVVGPMTSQQLREVIVGPATAAGVEFEKGLVDRIVAEATVGDALPLLGQLMRQIWPQSGGEISWQRYEQAGRVDGSIARYADTIHAALSAGHGGEAVDGTLLRLVGWDGQQLVRRWARVDELRDEERVVAADLRDARLVIDADDAHVVGLVHDALLRHWGTLATLGGRFTDALRLRGHLESVADLWVRGGRSPDGLLRGSGVEEAQQAVSTLGGSAALTELIRASVRQESTDAATRAAVAAAWAQQIRNTEPATAVALAHAAATELDDHVHGPAVLTLWALTAPPRIESLAVGHFDQVTSLAWDGAQLISAARDGTLCRWSAAGELLEFHVLQAADVVLLSPDGRIAAVAADGETALWTTSPPSRVGARNHGVGVRGLRGFGWAPDGRRLAHVDATRLSIFAAASVGEVPTLLSEADVSVGAAPVWSPDGERLALVAGSSLAVGPAIDFTPTNTVDPGLGDVITAAWSPDGERIAAVSKRTPNAVKGVRSACWLRVWRTSTGDCIHDVRLDRIRHVRDADAVTWSPDGDQVVVRAYRDDRKYKLMIFRMGEARPVRHVTISAESVPSVHDVPVCGQRMAWSAQTNTIAITQRDGICLYDVTSRSLTHIPQPDLRQKAAVSPSWRHVAVGRREGARVYDADSRTATDMTPAFTDEPAAMMVRWSPDSTYLAATNFYGIAVWSVTDGTLVGRNTDVQQGHSKLAWSADGARLARSTNDWWAASPAEIAIFDAASWNPIRKIQCIGTDHPVVSWSSDAKYLAVSEPMHGTRILNCDTAKVVAEYGDRDATCNAWATDGSMIAIGASNGTIQVVQASTANLVGTCVGVLDDVRLLAWSPGSDLLLAASDGKAVQLWNAHSGVPVAALGLPDVGVNPRQIIELTWSSDGSELRCVINVGTILTWTMPSTTTDVLAGLTEQPQTLPRNARQRFGLDPQPNSIETSAGQAIHEQSVGGP